MAQTGCKDRFYGAVLKRDVIAWRLYLSKIQKILACIKNIDCNSDAHEWCLNCDEYGEILTMPVWHE